MSEWRCGGDVCACVCVYSAWLPLNITDPKKTQSVMRRIRRSSLFCARRASPKSSTSDAGEALSGGDADWLMHELNNEEAAPRLAV